MRYKLVGNRVVKVDAREKALGSALYIDDILLPGMLYGKILRSPYAHARIVHIDISKALKAPGVKAVVTAKDLPGKGGGLVGPFIKDEPIFAVDKVRYVGEPVAAVAATDLAAADAAASLIHVEYEELPALFDPVEAMREGAPLIHDNVKGYFAVFDARRGGNVCSHTTFFEGDVERGFQESHVIVEETLRTPMQYQAYIEPIGAIAQFDGAGRVTVWSNTQGIFVTQDRICESLKIPMSKIRVIAPKIGGGFGGKIETTVQPHCVALAQKTGGRPVKIVLPREEDISNTRPRHPAIMSWKMGLKKDGTILASQMSAIFDSGAYADDGPGVVAVGAITARGPYRIRNIRMDSYCVYTNKVKTGAMRGFGNTQTTYSRECMLDIAARAVGMDPLELRMKNAIEPGDKSVGGQTLHSVGFKESLTAASEGLGWNRPKETKYRGRGMAGINHISGLLTVGSVVRLNEDGTFTIQCGAMDIGQGSDTVLVQIVAEEMGVPMDDVRLASGDTDATPYTWATTANRITYTGGNSVLLAARDVKRQMRDLAAQMLDTENLETKDKKIFAKGNPDKALTYHDLGKVSVWVKGGPLIGKSNFMVEEPTLDPRCAIGHPFGTPFSAWIFGTQAAEVEVDPDTGEVRVLKLVAAHDVGQAINVDGVEGQIEGGVVQGLGYGLCEAVLFDKGRITNPNLTDYKIPPAADVPEITPIIIETHDQTGPFGAKGIGEAALMGAAPAVANAIFDAIGVRVTELPMTAEKVLKAIQEKRAREAKAS